MQRPKRAVSCRVIIKATGCETRLRGEQKERGRGGKGEVCAVPRFRGVLKLPPGFVSCLGRVRRGLGEGELPLGSFPRWGGEVRPLFWCLFTRFLTERRRIPPACRLTPCCCALVDLFWLPLSAASCSSPTASALSAARSPAGQPESFREELCCGRSNLREHRDRGKGEAKASPWLQARSADVSPLRDPKSCHEGFTCHLCKSCFSSRVGIDIRRSPLHKSLLEAQH